MTGVRAVDRKLTTGDALLWLLVFAIFALAMCGCATSQFTCASCPPKLETQTIDKEVPCFAPIASLDPMVLPALPAPPPDVTTATDDEIDAWLADLRVAIEKREALALAHVRAMAEQIATHNVLEPRCAGIE